MAHEMRSDTQQLLAIATALAGILDEVPDLAMTSGGPGSIRAYIDPGDQDALMTENPWNITMFQEWQTDLRFALYQWAKQRPPYLEDEGPTSR